MDQRLTLIHAVTAYDRRQQARAKRPGDYNVYALPQYLNAVNRAVDAVESGAAATIREALLGTLSGRLLDACLRSIGEPKFSRDEMFGQTVCARF